MQHCTSRVQLCVDKPKTARDSAFLEQTLATPENDRKLPNTEGIDEIVLKAIAPRPDARYHSAATLSAERDMSRLLELILTKARQITDCDAGSLYVVETVPADHGALHNAPGREEEEPAKRLRFTVA